MTVETTTQKRAIARYVRISPSKVRRIANLVRGKSVHVALGVLDNLPHKGALLLAKVVRSAYANVKQTGITVDEAAAQVALIMINEAPVMKRHRPRAKGRMCQILKRSSHIDVHVSAPGGEV
ncbi:50S ribosomal protein L22 [bacterium]|jgi:large subunit ribosomal protein L22|nr:50S ribosomal protein L22 [bacterium]|tara:strand:+ start:901 stop:1266 length:366 start_codon:yes stop_codon:yes gene_type:complete